MSSPFFLSFNCIESPKEAIFQRKNLLRLNKQNCKSSKEGKVVYSLKQRKYIQKNKINKISLKSATIDSMTNGETKQNIGQVRQEIKYKKTLQISSQISIKYLLVASQGQKQQKLIISTKLYHQTQTKDSLYLPSNIRSTQATQLSRAQSTGEMGNILMKKQISNQSTEHRDYSHCGNSSSIMRSMTNKLSSTKDNMKSFKNDLLQRRNRPYTSVLVPQKLKFIEIDEQESERSPSLYNLNIYGAKSNEVYPKKQAVIRNRTSVRSNLAVNQSTVPSTKSQSKWHLLNISIRSTQSIKEEEESLDEFSQVLNKSSMSSQQRRTSLSRI